jgi:glycosyltransferase involved in cell wall biosynthesis
MILYPCRISPQKRPELLCPIATTLRRMTQSRFVIVVAGDGPLLTALETFVAKQGLEDCVKLLGAMPLERVAQLHHASDIFLLPSLIEGISLALFEAMAFESVPVVADVGGQRELVTPECGHLIAPGRIENELRDYAWALKQMIEQPETRRRMASASRARVRDHFHIRQMAATFIAALHDADKRHAQRAPVLPDAAVAREMATLAMDRVRLNHLGLSAVEAKELFEEQIAKQQKVIAKLQRQIEVPRAPVSRQREAHEVGY